MNKKIILSFCLFFILVCKGNSETLRVHPKKAEVKEPQDIFYSQVLPKWTGQKVMLITNPSGIGMEPIRIREEFRKNQVTIQHIIGLEHGFLGLEEEFSKTPVSIDSFFEVPVYHIYKIQKSQLTQLIQETDRILLDVQGMGMRVYTYLTVLKRVMDAAPQGKNLTIIDRIPPSLHLAGKGGVLEKGYESFAGEFPSPVFTGMTLGEAALYYNSEYLSNKVNIDIIPVPGFKRGYGWEKSGLIWHTPSPNLPTLESARNYFSLVFLEGINVSVGRGTQAPFIYFGAPWMQNPAQIAKKMDLVSKEKYFFTPVYFKPTFGPYTGKICHGLRLHLVDPYYDPIQLAYELISVIKKTYPESFQWTRWSKTYSIDQLWGNPTFRKGIENSLPFTQFQEIYKQKEKEFYEKSKKYYIY